MTNKEKSKGCCKECKETEQTACNFIENIKGRPICQCHNLQPELSKCCGKEKESGHSTGIFVCSKCYKPFESDQKEEVPDCDYGNHDFLKVIDGKRCVKCKLEIPKQPQEEKKHCIHTNEGICDTCKSDYVIEENNYKDYLKDLKEENCKYKDQKHGHCLDCGLLTSPIMECKCLFKQRQKEEWSNPDINWKTGEVTSTKSVKEQNKGWEEQARQIREILSHHWNQWDSNIIDEFLSLLFRQREEVYREGAQDGFIQAKQGVSAQTRHDVKEEIIGLFNKLDFTFSSQESKNQLIIKIRELK